MANEATITLVIATLAEVKALRREALRASSEATQAQMEARDLKEKLALLEIRSSWPPSVQFLQDEITWVTNMKELAISELEASDEIVEMLRGDIEELRAANENMAKLCNHKTDDVAKARQHLADASHLLVSRDEYIEKLESTLRAAAQGYRNMVELNALPSEDWEAVALNYVAGYERILDQQW